ncbi:MAG TPA: hypothetical protein VK177_17690 [Flavobacteriales bacterium]|nr:hypothetical protein [Flavobacteriales bacterium]
MKKQVLTVVLSAFIANAWAYKLNGTPATNNGNSGNGNNSMEMRAAGCAPGQARQLMEFNNVSALLEQGGLLFLDRSLGKPSYEVPKTEDGTGPKAIYGNSLWMGGKDFNDQLKAATIIKFRNSGNDFWAGPLIPGVATVDEATCAEYDKFYYANRAEVLAFYNDYTDDGTVSSIPSNIANWPAFGPSGQTLAPFYDADLSGDYDPSLGDMPWFQFKKTDTELPCGNDRRVTMYGDQAYWWVFNDKGNVHTESGGEPIGMEVHAQAFAFNTDDEVNDMTFYNYELINRSTQTLYKTYFGNFFDCDLGYYQDDYVGCDVSRGLGYYFNGDPDDATTSGSIGYGLNPPSIGVDYFQGPYQDADTLDNPLTTNYQNAVDSGGIPYTGIGIGYSDSVIDNERFGMREFMSYTGQGAPNANMSDPDNAPQAYNYLLGLWRDGSQLSFGGNGYPGQPGVTTTATDYIFFYDSDPYYWATRGAVVPATWREDLAGNTAADRRMIEASGPFTLEPGAYNNITVGIVYARASSGIPFESVELLLRADDKAQALFDNCFKILEGPNAPDVTTQELDKEVILMLSNNSNSNNYKERYQEADPFIILPEEAPFNSGSLTEEEIDSLYRSYRFQGYLIYQLANSDIKSGDLLDPDKARLVQQVDIKDGITKLLNWARDPVTGFVVPTLMVDGADVGIKHSFSIKTDAFTQSNLINHKTYYFMALAYASNNYKEFNPGTATDGQMKTFIQSRKTSSGEEVPVIEVIPHMPVVENGGTQANAVYGSGPIITRIEGRGNGGLDIQLTPESETAILADGFCEHPTYYGGEGKGPIEVKVIDPLNVTDHNFRVVFNDSANSADKATWTLMDLTTGESFDSDWGINILNEQIFPQFGFSITINQWLKKEVITDASTGTSKTYLRAELIRSDITYADQSQVWLDPVADEDGNTDRNWIRAGSVNNTGNTSLCEEAIYNDKLEYDIEQEFEKIIGGTVSPYHIAARSYTNSNGTATTSDDYTCAANTPVDVDFQVSQSGSISGLINFGTKTLKSVEIVLTPDKSKWSRCPVIETTDDVQWATGATHQKQTVKNLPSVDKNGNPGDGVVTTNPDDADFIDAKGMGWFPGYVIDVESGVRLNVAFGEDSRYASDNGKDMVWNPTSKFYGNLGEPIWGGKHYLYVFNNTLRDTNYSAALKKVPIYDHGATLREALWADLASEIPPMSNFWGSCSYVWCPKLSEGYAFNNPASMPCEVRMSIRVTKPYEQFNTSGVSFALNNFTGATNNWFNVYEFSMSDLTSSVNVTDYNDSILALINVVPNPYYAYSSYESNRLDNRIKIVNLPDECTIRIYNISGQLIRTITKSTNTITSVDWDLKNQKGIPIAGGVYLMHVEVPNVGERVLKWFGALRPTDLDNF